MPRESDEFKSMTDDELEASIREDLDFVRDNAGGNRDVLAYVKSMRELLASGGHVGDPAIWDAQLERLAELVMERSGA